MNKERFSTLDEAIDAFIEEKWGHSGELVPTLNYYSPYMVEVFCKWLFEKKGE